MFRLFYYATIGTGLANTGPIGAGIGIDVVFGALILGVAINPSLRGQLLSYAILVLAFSEGTDPYLTSFVEWPKLYWSYQCPDFLSNDDEELDLVLDSYTVIEYYFESYSDLGLDSDLGLGFEAVIEYFFDFCSDSDQCKKKK